MPSILRQSGLQARSASPGFTLVEMAVVLTIVAVLLGALLVPLASQHQMRKNKEAERDLREIKEALIGYAVANKRLPWPDRNVTPDGMENPPPPPPAPPPAVPCIVCEGFLPWQDLGVGATDPWGRIYRYRISREFGFEVQTGQPAGGVNEQMDLEDVGTVRVNTRGDDPGAGVGGETKEDIALTTDAAAVVLSLGSNGLGGTLLDGTALAPVAAGTDEAINTDAGNPGAPTPHFYSRRMTLPGGGACDDTAEGSEFCEFDDLVLWIPRVVLINRMIEAGRLP